MTHHSFVVEFLSSSIKSANILLVEILIPNELSNDMAALRSWPKSTTAPMHARMVSNLDSRPPDAFHPQ